MINEISVEELAKLYEMQNLKKNLRNCYYCIKVPSGNLQLAILRKLQSLLKNLPNISEALLKFTEVFSFTVSVYNVYYPPIDSLNVNRI